MKDKLDKLIDAAEAHAEKYDGDDRQHIKTDVMNAFYAGAKWQSENIEQEPVCYMQENQPYVYVSETKNEGSGYTIPLYTSPPNAKAIREKAVPDVLAAWDDLLEDLELLGMHEFEPYIKSKAKYKLLSAAHREDE